ncbi:MAG: hypothetical protein H7Y89_12285 [Steroidobacteraceae bacterium]|nr:hypothetical protein [Steroidobacteraceae bacterium]
MEIVRQPEGLIGVVLATSADFGDRHDAAQDLGAFDDPRAEAALALIACEENGDEDLSDAAGESLAEMWSRKGDVPAATLLRMNAVSRDIAMALLLARVPELHATARRVLEQTDGGS